MHGQEYAVVIYGTCNASKFIFWNLQILKTAQPNHKDYNKNEMLLLNYYALGFSWVYKI